MKLSSPLFLVPLLALFSFACEKEKSEVPPAEVGAKSSQKAAAESLPWLGRRSPEPGFPCDVEAVLERSCRRCHWDPTENDAPFGMVRYDDVQASRSGKPIFVLMKQMVAADLMPPLDALVTPKVTPLDPKDKETLLAWLQADAPRSTERCDAPQK